MKENVDLRTRTRAYAGAGVRLFCRLPKRRVEIEVLGRQLLKSGTSVAANYREACRARSDGEFVSKIEVCLQEADESELWLDLLMNDCGVSDEWIEPLHRETNELTAIFVSIARKVKSREH